MTDSYRDNVLKELVHDASELIELDRLIVRAVVESNFDKLQGLILDFRNKKINVQKKLSDLGVVEGLNEEQKQILDRVQRKFPTDNIIEQIDAASEENISFYELTDDEAQDIGSDLLYSWISHYEYVRDMFKVNTLILLTKIPENLRKYMLEARNCFAFQQYNAVISMCRTIIEAAAKDLCEKKGFFKPHGDKVIEINPEVFNQLIKVVSKGKLRRQAVRIYYREACPVVHGDRSVNAEEALQVLQETTGVVQELYSTHES